MPSFKNVIPEAQMAKPTSGTTITKADLEARAVYESFVKQVPNGQAGIVTLTEGDNSRGVAMRLRHAAKRLHKDIGKMVVRDGEVQFTVVNAKANGASAPAA